jgi:hypothetical protein
MAGEKQLSVPIERVLPLRKVEVISDQRLEDETIRQVRGGETGLRNRTGRQFFPTGCIPGTCGGKML